MATLTVYGMPAYIAAPVTFGEPPFQISIFNLAHSLHTDSSLPELIAATISADLLGSNRRYEIGPFSRARETTSSTTFRVDSN